MSLFNATLMYLIVSTVKTRGSGPGSVPYDKGDVFFPSNGNAAVTGEPQRTTITPIQSHADRQKAYKALKCLSIGSSAGGVGDHKNVIGKAHYVCFVSCHFRSSSECHAHDVTKSNHARPFPSYREKFINMELQCT